MGYALTPSAVPRSRRYISFEEEVRGEEFLVAEWDKQSDLRRSFSGKFTNFSTAAGAALTGYARDSRIPEPLISELQAFVKRPGGDD